MHGWLTYPHFLFIQFFLKFFLLFVAADLRWRGSWCVRDSNLLDLRFFAVVGLYFFDLYIVFSLKLCLYLDCLLSFLFLVLAFLVNES